MTPSAMRWAAASSRLDLPSAAAEDVARQLRAQAGEGPWDLVLAFVAGPGAQRTEATARALRAECPAGTFAAVSARGVVTLEHEVEHGVGLSVFAARLPGVRIEPFVMLPEAWADPVGSVESFDRLAPGMRGAEVVLMFGDPFTLDLDRVLGLVHHWAPGVRVAGGLASAGVRPGGNTVVLNDWAAHEGGFALALSGAIRADVVVSQGCDPIGPLLEVTEVEEHLVLALDRQPALERLEQVLLALPASQRDRLRQGLYVGRPARPEAEGRGDFLIRNMLGADRTRGAIAVADTLARGERIRLHVRDARAAEDDLGMLLAPQAFDRPASAALLFSCNGRGRGLYGVPDRDVALLRSALPATAPVAGMFCAGELGPVGERNHLHGHTASIVVLRPR